jgi:type I restriction enzyme S subunit
MSYIDEVIKEHCPNGVYFTTIGDLFVVSGAGVDKKINEDEQAVKLLNYMDVYNNRYISQEILTMEVTAPVSKVESCNIQRGDIFITPSSETIDDIGHAAVALETINGGVYSYHVMRLRPKETNMTTSFFVSYLFESYAFQKQILKMATGLTRFGLTKGNWEKIRVPLPSLPVQQEIVRILDNFTHLTAELTAELTARQSQYKYYRDKLLTFDGDINWVKLEDIAVIKNGSTYKNFNEGTIPVYGTGGIMTYVDTFAYDKPTVLIPRKGSIDKLYYVDEPFWNVDTIFYTEINDELIEPKFLYYFLQTERLENLNIAGGVPSLTQTMLKLVKIPLPPLAEQARIVSILDKFDALVNDLSSGIPAEIEARQKQYEYYRDRLLTFKEKVS